jgi:GNAT superfamily N-acetyltransferase
MATRPRIVIREAEERDVPAILELWREFADFHAQTEPAFTRKEGGSVYFALYLGERLSKDDSLVIVAARDRDILAYGMAMVDRRAAEFGGWPYGRILQLAVTGRARRQGLGHRLYERLKEWLVLRGVSRIEVAAFTSNPISPRFWRNLGFRTYLQTMFLDVEAEKKSIQEKPGSATSTERVEVARES